MRRNLFIAVLVPCILLCVLIILIIMDNQYAAKKAARADAKSSETSGMTNPTESETPAPTTTVSDTSATEPTKTSATAQTTTKAAATAQTGTTAKPAGTSVAQETQRVTTETSKTSETNADETEPQEQIGDYDGLYAQKGEAYTLIADKNTKHFLFVSNQDNSIRRTEFTYHPVYEQETDQNPVMGYKNNAFIFMAQNNIVASDGIRETILITLDDKPEDIRIKPVLQSDNRILSDINGKLYIIDCRSLSVEAYKESYSDDLLIFTDDYLCFNSKKKITSGPYYNYIYVAKDGKPVLSGSIGEIDEYALDNDIAYIQSQDILFRIDLKTCELTSSVQIDRERTLYFPVYGSSVIKGLSEIKYINYNKDNKPAESVMLPDFLEAECYYGSPYAISQFNLYMKDANLSEKLPDGPFGSFSAIDYTAYPLDNNKFLMHSTVKEELYSGNTCMGEGEIFLLERVETKNSDSLPFEMIYVWVPIKGESRAFQMYVYVPYGDEPVIWLNMVKQLLQIG